MKTKFSGALAAGALMLLSVSSVRADSDVITSRNDKVTIPHQADNTGKNIEDRGNRAAITADDQGQSEQDVKLAADIRRDVVKDDSLSTNAHNVKIIVNNGMITLRGPVDSGVEKQAIVSIASKYSTQQAIRDQIDVIQK